MNSRPDRNGSTRISWPGNLAARARTPGSRSLGARTLLVWSMPLDEPSVVGFRKRGYEGRDDDERSGRVTLAPISLVETTRNGAVGIPWWRRMIYHGQSHPKVSWRYYEAGEKGHTLDVALF